MAGKLNKISVSGGPVVPLVGEAGRFFSSAVWAEDGSIVWGHAIQGGMQRLPATGEPSRLAEFKIDELVHTPAQALPGGKVALFHVFKQPMPNPDTSTIETISFADGARKIVRTGGVSPRYLPSGHLIYVNKGTLFAIAFDLKTLATRGNAVPILNDIAFQAQTNETNLSLANNGALVYRKGGAFSPYSLSTIEWIDATGKRTPVVATPGVYGSLSLSPDGQRLALTRRESGGDHVWIYDLRREQWTKLTLTAGDYLRILWSPDSRYVLYGGAAGIFWTPADDARPQPMIPGKTSVAVPGSFTSDGRRLAYVESTLEKSGETRKTFTVPMEGATGHLKVGIPEPFFSSQSGGRSLRFSADGRWLAYVSNESGRDEVSVRPFPPPASGPGRRTPISNNGGIDPVWSRNRRELLYRSGDAIMAVKYAVLGDNFIAERPRVRVQKLGGSAWDVAPDGRILVATPVEAPQPAPEHTVVFLQNFFDEVRRRAPVER